VLDIFAHIVAMSSRYVRVTEHGINVMTVYHHWTVD